MKLRYIILLFIFLMHGCSTHQVQYEMLSQGAAKQVYTLKESCYVITFIGGKNPKPQVAGVLRIPGMTLQGMPAEVSTNHVGKQFGDKHILGIVPKGTTFTIQSIKTESSFETGPVKSPIIQPQGKVGDRWPLLDALWISDPSNRQRIHPAYLR